MESTFDRRDSLLVHAEGGMGARRHAGFVERMRFHRRPLPIAEIDQSNTEDIGRSARSSPMAEQVCRISRGAERRA